MSISIRLLSWSTYSFFLLRYCCYWWACSFVRNNLESPFGDNEKLCSALLFWNLHSEDKFWSVRITVTTSASIKMATYNLIIKSQTQHLPAPHPKNTVLLERTNGHVFFLNIKWTRTYNIDMSKNTTPSPFIPPSKNEVFDFQRNYHLPANT